MARHLNARLVAVLAAVATVGASCGTPQGTAHQREAEQAGAEVPQLETGPQQIGGGTAAAEGFGEETVETAEATPKGLHIATVSISPTTPQLRDAINFTGFRSGGPNALIELPVYGLNRRQDLYYLIVPVVNEGKEEVRNLEGRADFYDAGGRLIWSETQFLTHLPTRLQLNPPSLPNEADPQPELGPDLSNYPLYYLPTNMGLFTFAVPDPAVAPKVESWTLTFLVSRV